MEKNYAQRAKNIKGSAVREILKLLEDPEIISFAGGLPSADSFPYEDIASLTESAYQKYGSSMFQYGQTEGFIPLRHTLAKMYGVEVNNLITTTGSQQGLDLAAKVFLDQGDVILVENPTFLGALNTFKMYEPQIVPVETNENGIVISDLQKKIEEYNPKMLYVIPTFQNPTGITTSLEVRKSISDLASQHNFMVLEDDPYGELRYNGTALPSIYSLNKTGNVIFLATFSKTVAPGFRVAAALSDPDVIAKMTVGKQTTDVHSAMICQGIIHEYLESGKYQGHIDEIKELYRVRKDKMLECIMEYFPKEVQYTKPEGGLFIWCTLPGHVNCNSLFQQALDEKVAFVAGTSFYYDLPQKDNHMRLNFSCSNLEQIETGIRRLGQVIKNNL